MVKLVENNKRRKRNKVKKKGFSKKLLIADYAIAVVLLLSFLICIHANGTHAIETMNDLIEIGADVSSIVISPPFNLDAFSMLLNVWIAQLGISSGAYYILIKSEHKIELPVQLLNDLPQEVKEQIDMTQIITSVLSCTDN